MENELLGIGKVSALSGLPVSALRYYDGADVLAPAVVDPSSGYRYYSLDQVRLARLVAHLRRVGLPLNDIRAVLAEPAQAGPVLAAHLARLEAGLVDARREVSMVHHLLETPEPRMSSCTLPSPALIDALREVRYAAGADPDEVRLHGVYLDGETGGVRVLATDRYRLATALVATAGPTDLHQLVPLAIVDELIAKNPSGCVEVTVADGALTVAGAGFDISAPMLDVDFPSYQSLLEHGGRQVPVDAAALRRSLETGPVVSSSDTAEVSLVAIGPDSVHVGATDDPDAVVVAVNRAFLLQALGTDGQLTLGFDDPLAPLAIRRTDRGGSMSVLMPVRLDGAV